jgi:uncharacterized protein YciW
MSGDAQSRESLALAVEFLAAAELVAAADLAHPTVSCAVLAGTHANDAICQARTGRFSRSRNHADALRLARTAGTEGRKSADLYERLLAEKNKAQYDTARITSAQAQATLRRARTIVDLARVVIAG